MSPEFTARSGAFLARHRSTHPSARLSSMRAHRTPMRDEVRRFLLRSDFVKYAKTVPPEEEMHSAIAEVREFVTRTTPQEPVAPAAPTADGRPAPAGGEA